jgi:peptidoglycan/xylan/chitin deacetylase (PgdA/CDA1 family)
VVDFRTPRDGATYELGGTVNADYGCADNVGVTACTGSVANGAAIALDTLGAHTLSVTARDAAGNVATKQVTYTVKDTTAPTVSISSPTAGATFAWGQSATAGYSCADLALASCTATVGTASVANRGALPTTGAPGPGTRTLVVKATDASGNVTTQQAQYTVSPAGYYALTYDDGPNGIYTKPVLDALQSVNAKATFFVVGLSVQSFPELMRDIVSRGNWVENHTMTHTNLGPDDTDPATPKHGFNAAGQPEDPAAEISGLNDLIKQYTGAAPQFLRPPYGMYDQSTVDLAAQYGLTITNWTIDTNDWQGLSATQVVNNAMAVKPGGIILMHDAAQNTVTATPMIVNQLRDQKGMLPGKLAYSATPQFIVDWEDAGGGLGFHAMAVAP